MLNGFKSLLLLSCVFVCANAYSQNMDVFNGYYVATSGDTIYGQFYIGQIKLNKLKFKSLSVPGWKDLGTKDVISVHGDNGSFYFTHPATSNAHKDTIFIREIIHGEYSLFEGFKDLFTVYYYINSVSKPNLIRVNPRAVKEQFKVYFGPPAAPFLNAVAYNRTKLMRFINRLNHTIDPGAEQPKAKSWRPSLNLGLSTVAYYIPPIKIKSTLIHEYPFRGAVRPTICLSARVNINETFGINVGVSYLNKNAKTDSVASTIERSYFSVHPNTGEPLAAIVKFYYKHDFYLNLQQIEIPIGISINPAAFRKNSPIISLGINLFAPLTFKFKRAWGLPYAFSKPFYLKHQPTLNEGVINPINLSYVKRNHGYYLAAGFLHKISKKKFIEWNFQYSVSTEHFSYWYTAIFLNQATNYVYYGDGNITWQRFQLSVGYYFGLGKGR